MKKTWIILLFLAILGGHPEGIRAAITQRIIHAGDTPLFSDCVVTQTAPLTLRIETCMWRTTGQARIVDAAKVVGILADKNLLDESSRIRSGLKELNLRVDAGEMEYMPDGKRIRGWLKNKDGSFVGKSENRVLTPITIVWPADGQTHLVYLVGGPGATMQAELALHGETQPAGFIDFLIFETLVPVGATDFVTDVEVFTVLPGFPAPKGMFEK